MKLSIELPVQFRDYDVLGHVNSTVYLQYMETARVRLLTDLIPQDLWYRVPLIVASARCEYKRAIQKAHFVQVDVWVSRITERSWDLDYEVSTREGGVSAIGRTTQVAFDHDRGEVVGIDDGLRQGLESYREAPLEFRG